MPHEPSPLTPLAWSYNRKKKKKQLPARGVEFRFDVSLTAGEMGQGSGSRTALDIVTALTKRTMLQLGR